MTQPTGAVPHEFSTVAIVGVGLIGGSIALAAKQRRTALKVIGVGRNAARLAEASRRGIIDDAASDLASAARLADLIIFCTPVDRIAVGVREAAAVCRPGTLITDAGSTKGEICRDLAVGLPQGVEFVGAHPLAGSEQQGFEHASASLFENRVCVVTPQPANSSKSVARIAAFWTALGSTVTEMTPAAHDRALAETSHLPHVAAAALAATLSAENRVLAATGFRDTTRIASGDPELWTAILLGNRECVQSSLAAFDAALDRFRQAIEENDAEGLKNLLKAAKIGRDAIGSS
ncbi:MAG: prephenate dehydrogenase/arogenate dehydrogenase family protein [Planctomycetia bacterium]|nr:prephenate dehydrogenase/arogenate dehydrogenase family protein [Planctomycetia bacterium]